MIVIGIDPGLDGAVAALDDDIRVWDTPTAKEGKKRVFVPIEMWDILHTAGREAPRVHVFIEKVHSMPKQGIASAFNFGVGYGLWLGVIAGFQMPSTQVTPQAWMREMLAGMQKGKDSSRIRAIELFPDSVGLARKKDHGRADALLIAEYGRRKLGA